MDEEQGLQSPIAGGLRGIRRSVSSNIFGGGRAPVQAQPDPQTTALLQQNSLALSNVSAQLSNINAQVAGLNGSLSAIKENLAVSDNLVRQREAAKQNRERILAEQGLREGKESQIESRIQQALTLPVRRVAQKVQGGLANLGSFFTYLTAGWLTNSLINVINASADGNLDLFTRLKSTFQRQLIIAGATIAALTVGFKGILTGLGFLSTSALRIARGGLLRTPFAKIAAGIAAGTLLIKGAKKISPTGGPVGDAVVGAVAVPTAIAGTSFVKTQFGKILKFLDTKFPDKTIAKKVAEQTAQNTAKGVKPIIDKGIKGFIRKGGKFIGKVGGPLFTFVFNLLDGEGVGAAAAAAAGFFAGAKAGAALGATLGALVGGIGAAPGAIIGGLIGGFLGESAFKGIFKGIKALFGFKVGNEEEDEGTTDNSIDLTGDAVLSDDMVVESVGANPISIDAGSTNTVMGNLSEIGKKNMEMIASQNESLVASITPRSKNNSDIAQSISNMEEGAPQVVNFPLQGGEGGGAGGGGGGSAAPDDSANRLPKIGFDNSNIHTMYATSTYGANA